jgi:signal transduction histidine kinase
MTIRGKMILAYTIVFGVMLVCFALLVYNTSREAEVSRLDAYLDTHAMRLASEVEEQWSEGSFPALPDFRALQPEGLVSTHFRLLALDGSVVLPDSLLASLQVATGRPGREEMPVLQTMDLQGSLYRVLTASVEVNDTIAYRVQVASSLSGVESNLGRLRFLFLCAIPVGLLIASLAAFFITRAVFSPVSAMIATAKRISADNLDARLALPAVRDEVRLLGETLNEMMQRISSAFQGQRQFIADASHEIRTPLTIIQSELEYLERRTAGERSKEGLRLSLREVERLIKMTEGMLLLTKLDSIRLPLNLAPVRIDEILIECIQTVRAMFGRKRVRLTLHIQEAVEIPADGDRVKRVFLNLLDNALKYTRRGGTVSARLWQEEDSSLPVCVAIEDTGCGIAAKEIPLIFTRFYRADSTRAEGSGSGLGLAIAKSLVALHGGEITVRSKEGKGSVFTVRLPRFSS